MNLETLAQISCLARNEDEEPWDGESHAVKSAHRRSALAVATAVLIEAAKRCRLAKHGEIAAANIAMFLAEIKRK